VRAAGDLQKKMCLSAGRQWGYTLLYVNTANVINATLYEKLNFNFMGDIAPVAGISRAPLGMEVHPSFPAKTAPEFIAYAKANPGKITMASGGNGSPAHVAGELFKMMTGISMVHVPYRGAAPALTDLLGAQVDVTFLDMPSSIEYVRTGKVRALAMTTAVRSEALPEIPTVSEFIPGYEASTWNGIGAPKNTPAEIIDKLNKEINAGLVDPQLKARIAELGGTVLALSPAEASSSRTRQRSGPRWSSSPVLSLTDLWPRREIPWNQIPSATIEEVC
jgi:tripartite-type tricarboxylate transporter receptor subunit TctC